LQSAVDYLKIIFGLKLLRKCRLKLQQRKHLQIASNNFSFKLHRFFAVIANVFRQLFVPPPTPPMIKHLESFIAAFACSSILMRLR